MVPLGRYTGGIAARIDAASKVVSPEVAAATKLDPENTIADIVKHTPHEVRVGYKNELAMLARERYDWVSVPVDSSAS
jgi:Mg/Co/Ni transporter MgtE